MRPLLLTSVVLILSACQSTPPSIPSDITLTAAPPEIPTDILSEPGSNLPQAGADPSATPFVPTLTRLTEPGCCVQPFWSADGQTILFIDQPQPTAPTGIYGVGLQGGEPSLISERIALSSRDGRYRAYLSDSGETIVEPVGGDQQWVIPNEGLRIFFSPTSARIAWAKTERSGNFDQRPTVISIADIDGSDVKEVLTVYGGGISGWLDDDHLLVGGRDERREDNVTLFSYSLIDGSRTDLVSNQRIRSVMVAPGGEWITYTITLDPDGTPEDGVWVIKTDGSLHYKLDVAGAAQWRDGSHLLVIPYEAGPASHRLWQFDSETGEAMPLTDPAVTPFKVTSGDWSVSPTGDYVVFLSAADQALWLMALPPAD